MALFRRRRPQPDQTATDFDSAQPEPGTDAESDHGPRGPRDSEGEPVPEGYVDLGALYVPRVPGLQLRGKFEADKTTLYRILLVLGTSGVTVSVAAAPKSGGAWEELADQIAASIGAAGGVIERVDGPYGTELRAKVSATLPDGSKGYSPLRIVGVEGPRWVARLDIGGAAAAGDQKAMQACEELIDSLIINRGDAPRIRFEVLPLTLPQDAVGADGAR